ncbi:MAG: ATPase involved in archaellum/pili biosynthesis FlaI [Candidatus Methanohalarchaeum thermophilum]|uniref:ATPase involved in archaellum/pili biosynthesis FlaI n=1 Tax=Methanohalarchaeum thermophilum TaxID=1903181 RepID=A0A1Q6DV82_METT1|nr:MAG: ATPase involved in archaellum/pili biosynthesis FlaI [Candidatus Methanohalarchaeum thermophilum]
MVKINLFSKEKGEFPSLKNLSELAIDYNLTDKKIDVSEENKLERYWLKKGFSEAFIYYDPDEGINKYKVFEPEMDEEEIETYQAVKGEVKDRILKEASKGEKREILHEKTTSVCNKLNKEISDIEFVKLFYYLNRDFIGLGRLQPLMQDNYLEDISCNGSNLPVYVYHQRHRDLETEISFGPKELETLVMNIAQRSNRQISFARPTAEATLPDGSRAQLSLGKEVTLKGSTFTIRKFPEEPITPTDLVAWDTLSSEMLAYLWLASENKKNIMIVGGTATGKTTSLNAITLFVPWGAKVVTIEDTHEIRLPFKNWVPSITREGFGDEAEDIDMYDLLRSALRQRPEYIIVGEIRGGEAVTLFQAMSTGHTSFSTLHASSVERAIRRLENPPIDVPRNMLPALDLIAVQSMTVSEGERHRRITEIQEIGNYESGKIQTNLLFNWNNNKKEFNRVSRSILLKNLSSELGYSYGEMEDEIKVRKRVIEKMNKNKVRKYDNVVKSIKLFQKDKKELLDRLNIKKTGIEDE